MSSNQEIERLLENLTDNERKEVLSILDDFAKTGNLDKLQSYIDADYEEKPVTIQEFVTNPEYLGESLNEGGNLSVYPFWVDKLNEIFSGDKTKYNEVIFTGGIGLGKTTIAVIGMCYILHKLLCLRNPQEYYKLPPNSKIVFCLFNITLDLAQGVAFKKLNDMLLKSSWFMKHGRKRGKTNVYYEPDKGIEIITGSRASHGLGRDIFCLSGKTKVRVEGKDHTDYIELARLQESKKGENVVSWKLSNNRVVSGKKQKSIPTKLTNSIIRITLEDGTVIEGSDNHKMLMENGKFKALADIRVGDSLKEVEKCS